MNRQMCGRQVTRRVFLRIPEASHRRRAQLALREQLRMLPARSTSDASFAWHGVGLLELAIALRIRATVRACHG